MKEEVVQFIQDFFAENVFDITFSPRRNQRHDAWKLEWVNNLGDVTNNQRSSMTVQRVQEAVQNQFTAEVVRVEEPLQSVVGDNANGHRFDFYIPSERTAIEICLSAVKNEFEKDVLKGLLDHRVTTIYIMARDYVTGAAETHYGINSMVQPSARSIINTVRVYKLEVLPTRLLVE